MKMKSKQTQEKETTAAYDEATLNGITMRVYESGFASLNVSLKEGNIIIKGAIHEGKDGWFFSFPSYKDSKGKYHNQAYAMGDDLKTDIEILVKQLTAD